MKSAALKSLIEKAKVPLDVVFTKQKSSLEKYANARAELRNIYSQLAQLAHLTEEDGLELNRLTISCILNMFSSERAIFFPGKKGDSYSKEEMKSWLLDAEKELEKLQAYYKKTASQEDFDYYDLKLDHLGLKAEYYYHCLLDPTETNYQDNTLQLIQTMIVMLGFMGSLNDDLLEKNRNQLKRHCSYWLDNFLGKIPDACKNSLDCRCSFLQIQHNVNTWEYDNAPIKIWFKLCSLTQKIVKKWEHPISREIKQYFSSLTPPDSSELGDEVTDELEIKERDPEMPDTVQQLERTEDPVFPSPNPRSSSNLRVNSGLSVPLFSIEPFLGNSLSFAQNSLNTVAASSPGIINSPTSEQEILISESKSSDSIMPTINSGKKSSKRKEIPINTEKNPIGEAPSKKKKRSLNPLKLIEEAVEQLKKEKQSHVDENLNLQQRLENTTKKVESLNESYSKKISDQESKHNNQLIQKDRELNAKGIALEKLQKSYNKKDEEFKKNNQEWEQKYALQQSEIDDLQKTLAEMEKSNNQKITQLSQEKSSLESQMNTLRSSLSKEKTNSKNLGEQYDNLFSPFLALTQSITGLRKENQRLKDILSQKGIDEHEEDTISQEDVISNITDSSSSSHISGEFKSTNKVRLFQPAESTLNSTTPFAPIKATRQS